MVDWDPEILADMKGLKWTKWWTKKLYEFIHGFEIIIWVRRSLILFII